MKIACLHTLEANAALFDAACPDGVELHHGVREDLLSRAIDQGGADEVILEETAEALRALAAESGADGVLLTCTTIAPGAARAGAVRVDAALARAAAEEAGAGGLIDALITIHTTAEATRTIFEEEAAKTGAKVRVTLVDGALAAFQERRLDDYARLVGAAADASDAKVVALAQASMAPGADHAKRAVLTSPAAGLRAVIEVARRAG